MRIVTGGQCVRLYAPANVEPLDANVKTGSAAFFADNPRCLTRRRWAVGSKPNYFHHGQVTTIREAILNYFGGVFDSTSKPGQWVFKRRTGPDTAMMPMPLVAPLFIQDTNTESEITMVNNSSKALGLEISLTSLSGTRIARKTEEMAPYNQHVAKISELLAAAPSGSPAVFGSILLMPSRDVSLAAQLSIASQDPYRTNDIEEDATATKSRRALTVSVYGYKDDAKAVGQLTWREK